MDSRQSNYTVHCAKLFCTVCKVPIVLAGLQSVLRHIDEMGSKEDVKWADADIAASASSAAPWAQTNPALPMFIVAIGILDASDHGGCNLAVLTSLKRWWRC
jgi:hypothetical protein